MSLSSVFRINSVQFLHDTYSGHLYTYVPQTTTGIDQNHIRYQLEVRVFYSRQCTNHGDMVIPMSSYPRVILYLSCFLYLSPCWYRGLKEGTYPCTFLAWWIIWPETLLCGFLSSSPLSKAKIILKTSS